VSALPDVSVPITLRQIRRIHHIVDGAQTFPDVRHSSVWMCARGKTRRCTHVRTTTRTVETGTRVFAPGYPGLSPGMAVWHQP